MASQSAHFNMTKPASTDNYSLTVVNDNTDIIDTQMYNNQVSAAKVMVGATSSADGESGRVPAPTSADRGKYLKGDGTWDTPSGGGGGSSTLAGLTDVDLSSPTDGQALVYDATNQEWVNGTVSGGGGSGLTATILSNTLWSSAGTYTLNDDYDNYDILEIYFCNPSVAGQESDLITVMVNDVKALMNDSKILNLTGYGDRYVNCTFSADEFTITASNSGGVQKIVGYKAGGGSSEVKYSTTEQIVGTWIDGSDVWEKTINIEETTIHVDTPFTIDIETNVGVLIEHSLMYRDSSFMNGRWNPLDGYTNQINNDMYFNRLYLESNGTLKGYFAGSQGVVTICGVIRYTKVSAS